MTDSGACARLRSAVQSTRRRGAGEVAPSIEMPKEARRFACLLLSSLAVALLCLAVATPGRAAELRTGTLPPIRHVFLIVLENKSFEAAFGPGSPAPYLARSLPA